MTHSRVERIGTIFSRLTALWKKEAISEDKLPIWYKVYEAFPPKYEPRFDRPAPQTPLRNIFYKEDLIRAKFQKDVILRVMDLESNKMTRTQLFWNICTNLEKLGVDKEEVYDKALKIYTTTFEKSRKIGSKNTIPYNDAEN